MFIILATHNVFDVAEVAIFINIILFQYLVYQF
jgi:hypothetical protein